ncbi:MAG: hypothetical protein AAGC55_29595, partial [Myxococcota bacterium]
MIARIVLIAGLLCAWTTANAEQQPSKPAESKPDATADDPGDDMVVDLNTEEAGTVGVVAEEAGDESELTPLFSTKRLELSGLLGVHVFSEVGSLGAVRTSASSISNAVIFGPRLSYLLGLGLSFETELLLGFSSARDSDDNVTLFLLEPRFEVRLAPFRLGRTLPFITLGVGGPTVLS